MKTKHPVQIMVFGVITSNDDTVPPFIFPHDLTLNMKVYIKCQEEVVLFWIEKVAAERLYLATVLVQFYGTLTILSC